MRQENAEDSLWPGLCPGTGAFYNTLQGESGKNGVGLQLFGLLCASIG